MANPIKHNLPVVYGTSAIKHPDGVVAEAERNLVGRSTKMDAEVVTVLLREIISGKTDEQACRAAGISVATFYVWKRVNPDFLEMVARARREWTEAAVQNGLHQLIEVQAESKEDSARVRKAECVARHTLEIASRLNPQFAAKQHNVNVNVTADLDPVDLSKFLRR